MRLKSLRDVATSLLAAPRVHEALVFFFVFFFRIYTAEASVSPAPFRHSRVSPAVRQFQNRQDGRSMLAAITESSFSAC